MPSTRTRKSSPVKTSPSKSPSPSPAKTRGRQSRQNDADKNEKGAPKRKSRSPARRPRASESPKVQQPRGRSKSPSRSTTQKSKPQRERSKSVSKSTEQVSKAKLKEMATSPIVVIKKNTGRESVSDGLKLRRSERTVVSTTLISRSTRNDEQAVEERTTVTSSEKIERSSESGKAVCVPCETLCRLLWFNKPIGGPIVAHLMCFIILIIPALFLSLNTLSSPVNWSSLFSFSLSQNGLIKQLIGKAGFPLCFYDCNTWSVYAGFMVGQFILALLPLGRLARGGAKWHSNGKSLYYRPTGLQRLIITFASLIALYYLKRNVFAMILTASKNWRALIGATVTLSAIIGKLVYLQGVIEANFGGESQRNYIREMNSKALSGCPPYDMILGRKIHPRIPNFPNNGQNSWIVFDLKLWLAESCWILWATLSIVWVQPIFVGKLAGQYCNGLQILLALQLLYIGCELGNVKSDWLRRKEIVKTPLGLISLFVGQVAIPLMLSSIYLYFRVNQKTVIPLMDGCTPLPSTTANISNSLTRSLDYLVRYRVGILNLLAIKLFVTGLFIMRYARYLKNLYQRDCRSSKLTKIARIDASHGRGILCGSVWGMVRHPDALGEIMVLISWILLLVQLPIYTWILYAALIIASLHKMCAEEESNDKTDDINWNLYKEAVPYKLIPRFY